MKYKKYLLILLIALFIGCNNTYADTDKECYYTSSDGKTNLYYNSVQKKVRIDSKNGTETKFGKNDPLINKNKDKVDSTTGQNVTKVGNTCPTYIVFRHKEGFWFFDSDGIWGFNNKSSADKFANASNQVNKMEAWIVSYKKSDGTKITSQEYQANLTAVVNSGKNSGGVNSNTNMSANAGGQNVGTSCEEIFGSKNDPNSLRYLIDEILQYPRIIVPILLILYGTLDFAKAVIANKPDEMTKAQKTFIRRLIIGAAVFLVPILVDIIMWLADIVWEGLGYTTCDI